MKFDSPQLDQQSIFDFTRTHYYNQTHQEYNNNPNPHPHLSTRIDPAVTHPSNSQVETQHSQTIHNQNHTYSSQQLQNSYYQFNDNYEHENPPEYYNL